MSIRSSLLALCAAGALAFTGACATSGAMGGASSASGRESFTAKQLSSAASADVYDAIQVLDPQVLTGNGRGAPDVYIGNVKQTDGLDRLKNLSVSDVKTVTYLRYDKAQDLPDQHSSGGAIVVALP
ncbi:MAG: hypothetical protein ACYCVE_16460 [Gemmatimonadaceae bacterium]